MEEKEIRNEKDSCIRSCPVSHFGARWLFQWFLHPVQQRFHIWSARFQRGSRRRKVLYAEVQRPERRGYPGHYLGTEVCRTAEWKNRWDSDSRDLSQRFTGCLRYGAAAERDLWLYPVCAVFRIWPGLPAGCLWCSLSVWERGAPPSDLWLSQWADEDNQWKSERQ